MKEYIFEISDKTTVDGGHPSVKREEICRCADCLHWKKVKYLTKPKGIGTICTMTLQPRDADDFCCFGIKKEWLPETTSEEEVVKFAPVRHGRWDVLYNDNTPYTLKCSECGEYTIVNGKYCPNCGCKMDLDEVEE